MPMILNEEQNMLKDTAKAFCGTNAPISQLRKLRDEDSADGFDRGTWAKMVELGWSGIPWPEEYGGLAFGYKGLGVVTEETGRTLAASPLISTVWACGTAINLAGSQEQKHDLLGRIAGGELIVALALEESHRHDPYHIETKAREKDGVYKISGKKTFVLDGHVADKLIVVTRTSGKKDSRDGLTLFLDRPQDERRQSDAHEDGRQPQRREHPVPRRHGDARSGARHVGGAADILERTLDVARIGLAAEMLGSTEECFDRTIKYLKEREQFGVPIGSFQALKHRAADMFCEVELSKSVVLEALTRARRRARPGRDREAREPRQDESRRNVHACLARRHPDARRHRHDRRVRHRLLHQTLGVAEQTFGDANFHRNRYGELEGY